MYASNCDTDKKWHPQCLTQAPSADLRQPWQQETKAQLMPMARTLSGTWAIAASTLNSTTTRTQTDCLRTSAWEATQAASLSHLLLATQSCQEASSPQCLSSTHSRDGVPLQGTANHRCNQRLDDSGGSMCHP